MAEGYDLSKCTIYSPQSILPKFRGTSGDTFDVFIANGWDGVRFLGTSSPDEDLSRLLAETSCPPCYDGRVYQAANSELVALVFGHMNKDYSAIDELVLQSKDSLVEEHIWNSLVMALTIKKMLVAQVKARFRSPNSRNGDL